MNEPLANLTQILVERLGITPQQLFDVLFALRAHRTLAGIVICCRRLTELYDQTPEIAANPAFEDLKERLDLITQIAALEDVDPHFLSGSIDRNRAAETPLRPYTGDSGLCDLLLICCKEGASAAQEHAFEVLLAWFVWQMFHHQAMVHDPDQYRRYLEGERSDLIKGPGSRVYSAFRALRDLADPRNADLAIRTAGLCQGLTISDSVKLARVLKVAHSKAGRSRLEKILLRETGSSKETVQQLSAQVLPSDAPPVSADLGRFLQLIWLRSEVATRDQAALRRDIERRVRKVEVRRYGPITTLGHEVDEEGMQGGFLLELVEHQPAPAGGGNVEADDEDEDDPGDGESVEPDVTLYLGQGSLISSWYAAKSVLHHIERQNALLPWPASRLSQVAIQAVAALVMPQPTDDWAQSRARLTIGLSLLTGRPLSELSGVRIQDDAMLDDESASTIIIIRSDHQLRVPAGRPELKQVKHLPQFCAPVATTLRLPLPLEWRHLIDSVDNKPHRRHGAIIEAARQLIASLPAALGVTPRGIAGALRLALLEHGRDDLALLKVVVDANDANLNNLIHYASYGRDRVESLWRQIVTTWVGALADPHPVDQVGERVGSPQGIEIEKLAPPIAELKRRFHAAVREQRWPAAYNILALYLSIWMGVATAGRRTRQPVPSVITTDGWALVRDKHRPDGSTDRYVPLGLGVREQIKVLRTLSAALAITDSDFDLPAPDDGPLVHLRVFTDDSHSVPYQPKFVDHTSVLRDLPTNAGRKLVRSSADELPGRFKDAGLGHWVRGRHPWTLTSCFPSRVFREQWLGMQARLEKELGFEVLRIDALALANESWVTPLPSSSTVQPATETAPTVISVETVERLLGDGPEDLYRAVFDWETPSPEAALGLVRDVLRTLAKRRGINLAAYAEGLCEYIRIRTKIPLFAHRPRARFQRNWMVDSDEFRRLAYVQEQLIPAIIHDLAHLPTPSEESAALMVDAGRLIAASVLRGGIANVAHLDVFLGVLAGPEPIQAVGNLRFIELKVRHARSSETMRRSILLEPYLASLISVERCRLSGFLSSQGAGRSAARDRRWDAAFRAYLRSLGLADEISLSAFTGAIRQRIQLQASPVIAAYASGELLTDDLPLGEFRRLAGLAPAVTIDDEPPEEDSGDGADVDARFPEDLNRVDYARKIGRLRSRHISEWLRVLRNELKPKPQGAPLGAPKELLCHFAIEMVERSIPATPDRFGRRAREIIARNLEVVWHGLQGFAQVNAPWSHIDEATLQSLWDATAPHFRARIHHGAWGQFRSFLVSRRSELAKRGIEVGTIASAARRPVSAKILSGAEIERIAIRLNSVQSGIGSLENRIAAQRHFLLTEQIGARRAETEKLRCLDLDGDMIRIRPFEGRSLKTASSERAVPMAMLTPELLLGLDNALESGQQKPIDAGPDHHASGDNFFDRVSRAMKAVTGDPDIGPHHLRHNRASMLLLTMLANAVDLDSLSLDLPWARDAKDLLSQRDAMLSTAQQCGQGLKAIAALLGHLHETTTLRHYVHTLCIALHAYQLGQPPIPLHTAFEHRLLSRASVYREWQRLKAEGLSIAETQRRMRDVLEARAQTAAISVRTLVFRDETPLVIRSSNLIEAEREGDARVLFDQCEAAHRYLEDGVGEVPDDLVMIRSGLHQIAAIPSGRRGSQLPRHPMMMRAVDGTPLPGMLLSGLPVRNGVLLIAWLQRLKAEQPADYDWLIAKWLNASESAEGSMRLDGDEDRQRADRLPIDPGIRLEVRAVSVSKRRQTSHLETRYRLRIRFVAEPDDQNAESPEHAGRGAGVLRWVMTWVCVMDGRLQQLAA